MARNIPETIAKLINVITNPTTTPGEKAAAQNLLAYFSYDDLAPIAIKENVGISKAYIREAKGKYVPHVDIYV